MLKKCNVINTVVNGVLRRYHKSPQRIERCKSAIIIRDKARPRPEYGKRTGYFVDMLFVEPSNLGINYCGDVINGKICRGFCIGVAGGDSKAAKICQHVDIIQIVSGRNDVVLGNAELVGKRADSGAFSSAARNGIEIKAVRADVYPHLKSAWPFAYLISRGTD